ncbi:hypothetical protein CPB84DRAFT_1785741, partial [Gymnopilus junonius]
MNPPMLFVGDGSLRQLTVQEISTVIRQALKPIIFVTNNQGYTVERCIHGKRQSYSDIADWDWQGLLNTQRSEKIRHSQLSFRG